MSSMLIGLTLCLLSAPPSYDPTDRYQLIDVEGWKVHVHRNLLSRTKKP